MSSAQDNKIREIQHADILQSQYHDEITMHENQPCPKTEIPLPGPSGILVMSDEHLGDFSEEACQERIQGSQGTGTSQAKNWLSRNVISGECSPQNSLKIKAGHQGTKKKLLASDSSNRRKRTIYKFWDGVRRHTLMGMAADLHDEDDWDSNLWFTSLDDFHTPKCALGRSDKHDKYFVKAQSHRKHFLMHVWHKDQLSPVEAKRVRNAQSFAQTLRHPNIIRFLGEWETDASLCIVEEYCFTGDMAYQLVANKRNLTESYVANSIVRPLLCALSYLHNMGIAHRAVWPKNILISRDGETRLACFLYAIDMHSRRPISREGYIDYMPPEMLRMEDPGQGQESPRSDSRNEDVLKPESVEGENNFRFGVECAEPGYDEKVDIWQLGILVFELLTGRCPFEVDDPELTATLILWTNIQKYPAELSSSVIDFLELALAKDPAQRPSADELIDHPWIKAQQVLDSSSVDGDAPSTSRCQTPGFFFQAYQRISSFFARFPLTNALKSRTGSVVSEPMPHRPERAGTSADKTRNSACQSTEDEEVKRILMSSPVEFTPVETPAKIKQEGSLRHGAESAQSRIAWTSPSPPGCSQQAKFPEPV